MQTVCTPDAVRNAKELGRQAAHATEAACLAKEHMQIRHALTYLLTWPRDRPGKYNPYQ
jgi:hypothetical protein